MPVFIQKAAKCLNPVDQIPADAFATQTRQLVESNLVAFNVRLDQSKDSLVLHSNELAISLRNRQELAAQQQMKNSESKQLLAQIFAIKGDLVNVLNKAGESQQQLK